ncbi:MAG: SDR family oxidoreductase [Mycobacterium sp.]
MHPSKIAIVSGASRGIGRAIAEHLAASGVGLVITYRSGRAEAESLVDAIVKRGGTAVALELDAADMSALGPFVGEVRTALRQTWHRDTFDYLINNAGVAIAATFADTTEAEFDELLAVNFKGVFFLTQQLLPLLADNGRIVNITGGLTRFTGPPTAAYAAMKGAVEVLSRHLAAELGPRGITVNIVAPGPTAGTELGRNGIAVTAAMSAQLAAESVFGRIGQPDDIAAVVTALVSDGHSFVTGQRIEVSGGSHL